MLGMVFSITCGAGINLSAQQSNLNRWLEECLKIQINPAISIPMLETEQQKAQYAEAAEKGNMVAQLMMERNARLSWDKEGMEKWGKVNQGNKIETILREQASSNAYAQMLLSDIYNFGLAGVGADDAKAVEWIRKAADQGLAHAQNSLGENYEWGRIGLTKDLAQGTNWYKKAADQGFAAAQFNLARMYLAGNGVPKDEAQATSWYKKAADQGYEQAVKALAPPASAQASGGGGNQKVARIDSDGRVFNERNAQIGKFDISDGRVFNERNAQIGKVDKSDGRVFNERNAQIGKVDKSDGRVLNERNAQIGKIDMSGGNARAFNERNAQLGTIRYNGSVNREFIAAAYFFFFK
jgi:TPR repeat protein